MNVVFEISRVDCITITETYSVRIEPELTHLWLLDGSSLRLDCIYTRPSNAPADSADFYYNGQIISVDNNFGFEVCIFYRINAYGN